MPVYKIQSPSGKIISIESDSEPTQETIDEAISIVESQQFKQTDEPPKTPRYSNPPQEFSPKERVKQGFGLAGQMAQIASIPFGLAGTPIAVGGRVVEGLAKNESLKDALSAGAGLGLFDLSTAGIGKGINAVNKLSKVSKASKVTNPTYKSASDVLKQNKDLFRGKNKIPTKKLSDPRYVDAVGSKTAENLKKLQDSIIKNQQEAVSKGTIKLNTLSDDVYASLINTFKNIPLNPEVSSPKTYQSIIRRLKNPDVTIKDLYDARKLADEAINYNDPKVFQKPYQEIRKKIDSILRDPKINSTGVEYGKQTDNLNELLKTKVVKNLVSRSSPSSATAKFGQGYSTMDQASQKTFQDAIRKLRLNNSTQKKQAKNILEATRALDVSKAFRDTKPPLFIGELPYVGGTLSAMYKRNLPKLQNLSESVPFGVSRLASRSTFPIENRNDSGELNNQNKDRILRERGLIK